MLYVRLIGNRFVSYIYKQVLPELFSNIGPSPAYVRESVKPLDVINDYECSQQVTISDKETNST